MFQNKFNLCSKEALSDVISLNLAFFGIPPKCPTKSSTFCYKGNTIVKLSAVTKKFLPLFENSGSVKIRLNISFNDGFACFEAEHSVEKIHSKV